MILTNKIDEFAKYNFPDLWLKTENDLVYGIMGEENQRILIKILTAVKSPDNPREYIIQGKSKVKDNVCAFNRKITIQKINESKRIHFGPDNEFKNRAKTQGLLIAKYEFFEQKNQRLSGVFSGILRTKWYLDKNNRMTYDDINFQSDGYFNNSFVGIWKMYDSKLVKKCNWADYRVPNSNCDFDIGAGDFSISKKYRENGWLDIGTSAKRQWWR